MTLDILVLLIIVALIFQRLWKVLGTVNEDEPRRIKLSREGAEKLYNLLKSETEKELQKTTLQAGELTPIDEENLNELDKTLLQIPNFDRAYFINGAKKAFEMITKAFNSADEDTLKVLVSPQIVQKMINIIKQRQKDNITAETDFIGFDDVSISSAKIEDNKALITVNFNSEQVNFLRAADGQIIEGDENYIQNITDVWTFERSLNATKAPWLLVSTEKTGNAKK